MSTRLHDVSELFLGHYHLSPNVTRKSGMQAHDFCLLFLYSYCNFLYQQWNFLHQKDRLHRKAMKSGNTEDLDRHIKSCSHVTALTRSAKQQYLATLDHNLSNDSHKFWRNVKHLSTQKKFMEVLLIQMLNLSISTSLLLFTNCW